MKYHVYMLISLSGKPVTYVGYTNNLKKRVTLHNRSKGAKFTRGRKWKLIYTENEYLILVYYRNVAYQYDSIIGIGNTSSFNLRN